jgi:hypothetical protein
MTKILMNSGWKKVTLKCKPDSYEGDLNCVNSDLQNGVEMQEGGG